MPARRRGRPPTSTSGSRCCSLPCCSSWPSHSGSGCGAFGSVRTRSPWCCSPTRCTGWDRSRGYDGTSCDQHRRLGRAGGHRGARLVLRNPPREEQRDHSDEREESEGRTEAVQPGLLVLVDDGLGDLGGGSRLLERGLEVGVRDEGDAALELHG